MKKIIASILFGIISLQLVACREINTVDEIKEVSTVSNVDELSSEDSTESIDNNENDILQEISSEDLVYDTDFFTIEFPEKWYDKYNVIFLNESDTMEWSVNLKEEITKNDEMGCLFSIVILNEDINYYDYPEYEFYGRAQYGNEWYNIIVTYPSDVQYENDFKDVYLDLQKDIKDIIEGLQLKSSNIDYNEINSFSEESEQEENIMDRNGEIDEDGIPFVAFWGNMLNEKYTGRTDSQMWRSSIVEPFALYQSSNMKCYYNIDDDSYYGVDPDGNIVSHSYNWFGSKEIYMRNFWDSKYDWVEPKVVSYGDMDFCIWKIANGYLVVTTICYENPYENWGDKRVYAYSVMTDKNYCAPFREKNN